ncbi:ImmA/IrrE family metallo-endopeptidase [Elizabethkingia ursingii]|uniref:ImmA/IrrE family metallo-endopeptidase n=1 Tax=Elizabethkingia ursingii TaxID=1756150 RepID=UPI0020122052|nr:ImmA/IrrE family metallo-endopeptidase [Elizabethkingia ursingii]MCL1673006.1 ImmA/IrrE family metallo-endopeptidase [Elizabethkingia ursingii]
MDKVQLDKSLKKSKIHLDDLLDGKVYINKEVASVLAVLFKNSENFWINKQLIYDERVNNLDSLEKEEWIKSLPIKEIIEEGFLDSKHDLYEKCLNFFDVHSIFDWKIKYLKNSNLSFRKSEGFDSKKSSVITWLRMGELHIKNVEYPKYNRERFEYLLENDIKDLTRKNSPKIFIPKLVELCHSCGVKLSIQKAPKNCKVYGVTKFSNEGNPLMILSFRYLSDDQFWFTFFHEAGHVILHEKKFLNFEEKSITETSEEFQQEELEANLFAEEVLVPFHLKNKLSSINGNKKKLIAFSMEANVSPGIVVGQLQNKKYISQSYLNAYKRRFSREDIDNSFKGIINVLTSK